MRRKLMIVSTALVALVLSSSARAADEGKVAAAVAKGNEYLTKAHAPGGNYTGGQNGVGSAALAGLALLESGSTPMDPSVVNIANFIRSKCLSDNATYMVSLSLLFLDRLGDPADVPVIQYLGVKLYEGLTSYGGWGYATGPALTPEEVARVQAALQQPALVGQPGANGKNDPPKPANGFPTPTPMEKPDPAGGDAGPTKLHSEVAKYFLSVRQSIRNGRPGGNAGEGDNSNTQFGLIALWVATRHGMPADDAFALIEARFLSTQNKADAGWSYTGGQLAGSPSSVAMTCAGLLGLAVGGGRGRLKQPAPAKDPKAPTDPDDPFLNPKKPVGKGPTIVDGMSPQKKLSIQAALTSIGRVLAALRQNPANGFSGFIGGGNEYYMLWSLERVAVAYNLETIGDVDWYSLGCDFFLPAQGVDGAWSGAGGYGPDVSTAFAMLFMLKANFVRDLSRKLDVKDPGKTELRGGSGTPLQAPKTTGSTGSETPAKPGNTPAPTPSLPAVTSEDPFTEGLVAATGTDWATNLQAARETKGSQFTAALVRTIPRIEGDRQKQAREALAERLTRMTAVTLRTMLNDNDSELRRAACLAVAMKDDKTMIPDLIAKISDPVDFVVRAARAGLRAMTEQDFGPMSAENDARTKAAAEWKKWYDETNRR